MQFDMAHARSERHHLRPRLLHALRTSEGLTLTCSSAHTGMEPSFKKWLVRHDVTPKVLKALKKEEVTNDATLKAMRDSDLETLKTKYKLPMGQYVILRSARDELIREEGAQASSKGKEDSFEELHSPPEAGEVEREVCLKDSAPVLSPSRHGTPRRLKENEIRDKYKLPARNDKYNRLKAHHNGASAVPSTSATPSPLPDENVRPRTRSPVSGASGGLQVRMYT